MAKIFKPRISAYVRNVGRSLGYAVGDAAGEYAPVLKSIVSDTKDAIAEAKTSSGDIKSSIRDMIKDFNSGPNILTNTLDDLKSGNWYNKQREDDALNDMFGGFDFDDEDWGDFDFDDDDSDTDSTSDDARDTKAIINSMDDLGMNISNSVAASTARSAEYIVAHQKASTRAMYELTGKGFNQVSNILLNMSDTMVGLASLGEPLTQHINNSSVFYTKTTEQLGKISESLETLVKRTAYMDSMNKGNNGKGSKGLDRFVSGGEFSLASYIDMVKENTKEQVEMVKGLAEVFGMAAGKGGKNMSLTTLMTQGIVKKLLPDFFKASAKQLSESINNAIISGLMRGSKKMQSSGNLLLNLIGGIFFPELKTKNKVDTSKYNRGPIQWDGESKQALTRVIPDYLAKIYGAISGDTRFYDYETGRYKTLKNIKQEKTDFMKTQTRQAGGELRRMAYRNTNGDVKAQNAIDDLIARAIADDKFDLENLYKLQKDMSNEEFAKLCETLGLSNEKAAKALRDAMKSTFGGYGNKNRNAIGNFEREVYSAKARVSAQYKKQEESNGIWRLDEYSDFLEGGGEIILRGGNKRGKRKNNTKSNGNTAEVVKNVDKKKKEDYSKSGEFYNVDGYKLSEEEFEQFFELSESKQQEFLESNRGKFLAREAESFGKGIINRLKSMGGGKLAPIIDFMGRVKKYALEGPLYSVSVAMDKFTQGINELFWGGNGTEGIIDQIKTKITDTWQQIKDKFNEMFPKPEGSESLKDAMKREWGNVKNYVGNKVFGNKFGGLVKGYFGTAEEKRKFNEDLANARAFGEEAGKGSGLIRKLPSHRLSSAFRRTKRFKSTMFSGGASTLVGVLSDGREVYKDDEGNYIGQNPQTGNVEKLNTKDPEVQALINGAYDARMKEIGGEIKDTVKNSAPIKAIGQGAKTLGQGIMDFFGQVAYGGQDIEKQKQTMMGNISKTMQDLAPAKGAIGIGAIGGVGVSLLTGALVGPIAGAAIGAGVGLATKSQAFQDFLFGTGDPESDDYQKGLLGGFGQALKADGFKSLKDVGFGAGAGAAVGTIMGSPIVGAIVGGAAGYVASSEKAKTTLFGTPDDRTTLGKAIDKIKEHMPNMTAGMIAGLVAGPFGLAGNLVFGAGLGYLSTSNNFKKFMFGDEEDVLDENGQPTGKKRRVGGLAGQIHDRIINPLDDIMHNLGLNINARLKSLFASITGVIIPSLKGKLKGAFNFLVNADNFLSRGIRGAIGLGGKAVTGAVDLTGGILGGIDRATMKSNLRIGANIWDRKNKRKATSAERLKAKTNLATSPVVAENGGYYRIDPFTGKKTLISKRAYEREQKKFESGKQYVGDKGYDAVDRAMAELSNEDITSFQNDPEKVRQFIADKVYGGDISKVKNGELRKINDLFKDEYKGRGLDKSPAEKAQDATIETAETTKKILSDVDIIKTFLTTGKLPEADDNTYTTLGTNENGELVSTKEGHIVQTTVNRNASGEFEVGARRTEFVMGEPVQYVLGSDGEWHEDKADNETSRTKTRMEKFTDAVLQIPVLGGALKGISAGFSKFGKFLFGDEKEGTKGLLGGIAGLLGSGINAIGSFFGIDNAVGMLKGIPSKLLGGIKGVAGKLFTKEALSFGFSNFIAPALLIGGFTGKFDDVASAVTKGAYAKESADEATTYEVTTADGQQVTATKDVNGNFVDSNGNILDVKSVDSANRGRDSLSDKLKKNALRGGLTGGTSVTHSIFKRTALGKKLFKAPNQKVARKMMVANARSSAMEYGGEATLILAKTNITDMLKDLGAKLKGLDVIKRNNIDVDGMVATLSEKIGKKMSSQSAKSFMKNAARFASVLSIGFIAGDFITGMEDARTTLGIIDEPTTGQRIVAGLLRVIKNAIPVVGTLLPDELLIDVFCDYVAPALGIDVEELKNQRAYAQESVDAWNALHPDQQVSSVGDFNKQVLKDYTTTERISNAVKGTWEDTKVKAKNFAASVKEKGLGGTLKEGLSNMATDFMSSYQQNGGGLGGIFGAMGDSFQKLLPGVLGDINKARYEIMKFGAQGDLKSLWSVSFVDKGGEKIEGTDLTTAVPSMFTRIIGQIPLLNAKLIATPLALVSKVGIVIKDAITEKINKIKETVGTFSSGVQSGEQKIIEGNPEGYWDISDISDDPENPLSGIMRASALVGRAAAFPVVWFKAYVAKPIKDWITPKIEAIKTDASTFKGLLSKVVEETANKDSNSLAADIGWKASEDNPIGGLFEVGQGLVVTAGIIGGAIKGTFNAIKGYFGEKIDKFKQEGQNYSSAVEVLKAAASKGEFKDILAATYEPSEEAGGGAATIYKVMFRFSQAGALVGTAFNKVMEPVKGIVNSIAETATKIGDKVKNLTDGALGSVIKVVRAIFGTGDDEVEEKAEKSGWFQNLFNFTHESSQIYANPSGGASGFVSQFDPRFQSYQVSGTNFAGKGCGPAVASMTAAALGKSLPVGSAVNASQGYQTANGVSLDYFANALGSRGIDTEYIAGGGAGDLYRSIASGKKVVLLGQDASNTSKAYSPFGPNNHYVVATGLDRSGNVVVNDPEMNRPTVYNPGILGSVKYGVAAGRSGLRRMKLPKLFRRLAGGGNPRNDETTQTIWTYLTQKLGMSEAAAAGVMGNMEAESGCQPDRHQTKGSAYGLCQWDGTRKTTLMKLPNYQTLGTQLGYLASELPSQYWKKSGTINDIDGKSYNYSSMTYEQFKSLTDVATATIKFEAAFERAGKPRMANRLSFAKAYYEMFSGKAYNVDLSDAVLSESAISTAESGSTTEAESEDKYSFKSIFGVASTIGSIFSDALGGIFNKEESTTNGSTGSSDTNPTAATTEGESYSVPTNSSGSKIVDLMKSKLGQLKYSMSGPRDPDKGSADCSSTVRWAVRKASGVDIGDSTPAQYENANLSTVWYGNGAYANEIPASAKPGDILFFSRPNKDYSKGRKDRVGHVEIYEGNGMMIGHGSGMGPKEKSVPVGSKGKLIKISRVNQAAAGSGLLSYSDLAHAAGGSSGILMNSRAGSRNGKPSVLDPHTGRLIPISRYAGGATTLAEASQNMLNSVKSTTANNSKGISPELIAQLLSSITAILNNIADNTAPVNKIYQALVAYLESGGASGTSDNIKIKKKPEKLVANDSNMSNDVDQNIKSLVATLAELAKG